MLIYLQIKPLNYWKANEAKYLILALIARKYLSIPASSASSKRFFSQRSLIISKTRNRLSKETFEKIICLKSQRVFNDEEEQEEKKSKIGVLEEDNAFYIEEKE